MEAGNSKRHRNPPLLVKKLVCFSKDTWNSLKRVVKKRKTGRFAQGGRANLPAAIVTKSIPAKKKISIKPIVDIRVSSYEATNIETTRDSEYWRWQRLKEYGMDISDKFDNPALMDIFFQIRDKDAIL